jgi:hypothetical protein
MAGTTRNSLPVREGSKHRLLFSDRRTQLRLARCGDSMRSWLLQRASANVETRTLSQVLTKAARSILLASIAQISRSARFALAIVGFDSESWLDANGAAEYESGVRSRSGRKAYLLGHGALNSGRNDCARTSRLSRASVVSRARQACIWAVLALVFCASRNAFAFRSGRDVAALAGTDRVRFASDTIPFSLSPTLPPGLDLAATQRAIADAAATWSGPQCSGLQFFLDGVGSGHATPGDGVNTIEWVSDWAARGFVPLAAGQTDVQYVKVHGQWSIAEADVYLNATFKWTTETPAVDPLRSVRSVVTHELGHVLGLQHPCELDGANGAPVCAPDRGDAYALTTMYPLYSETEETLSADDADGACFLYPASACTDSSCPAGQSCTASGCAVVCAGDTCAAGEMCTTAGCRPENGCRTGDDCTGDTCELDADCGLSAHCVAGACAKGKTPSGDPCDVDNECVGGACIAGHCAARCLADTDCLAPTTCVGIGDVPGGAAGADDADPSALTPGVCSSPLAAVGETCTHATDCQGGFCVAGAESSAVCSRACGSELPACPSGWRCDSVMGQSVCAPSPAVRSCSLGVSTPKPNFPVTEFVALTLMLGVARRKRRNTARRSSP